jgi:hypothetical protein
MNLWRSILAVLTTTVAGVSVLANDLPGEASREPRITAQGFSVDTTLVSQAHRFDSVRVRIEAPSRIGKLLIATDTHEIDLARTQDRSLFAIFGLSQRPLSAYDVTLDLAPFMNDHFTTPATYRIEITVTDRDGGQATTALTATVISGKYTTVNPTDPGTLPRQLRETAITLTRWGSANVEPAGESPLTWITREAINVTIRLRPARPDSEIRELSTESWHQILTPLDLEQRISSLPAVPYIDVPTASNGAADTILAVSDDSGDALIRVISSATSLSALGTTVTLTAHIRD